MTKKIYNQIFLVPFIIFLLLTSVSGVFSEGMWEVVRESELKGHFSRVQFFDANQGFAVGNGILARTTDGGKNWKGYVRDWQAVHFISAKEGFGAKSGIIYHTVNGGITWKRREALDIDGVVINRIYFINEKEGYLTAHHGGTFQNFIYHTNDGGLTWTKQYETQKDLDVAFLFDIYFLDDKTGWVVGMDRNFERNRKTGIILHTTDGGKSWKQQNSNVADFSKVFFVDKNTGWIVGNNSRTAEPVVLRTVDGGEHWEKQDTGLEKTYWMSGVYFINADVGWAIGRNSVNHQGIVIHTQNGGETWKIQSTFPVWLSDVYFVNANHGWMVGLFGFISHTLDGGKTWMPQTGEGFGPVYAVSFTNPYNGWAAGSGVFYTKDGIKWETLRSGGMQKDVSFVNSSEGWVVQLTSILHTSDSGETWEEQFTGQVPLEKASFVDEQNGWVVGYDGSLLHTSDGGETWIASKIQDATLKSVFFIDADNGFIAGSNPKNVLEGTVFRTRDGGKTWERKRITDRGPLNDVWFVDKNEGWVVGDFGAIFHTKDGGEHWESQSRPFGRLFGVTFLDNREGFTVGGDGLILHTQDGGETWIIQKSGTKSDLYDVRYDGGMRIYAVGMWGTILRYTDKELQRFAWAVSPTSDKLITSWGSLKNVLYQNYPNPFNPETFIPYQLASDSKVTIKIYDVSGKLVRTLSIGEKKAGLYVDRKKAAHWDGKNQQGEGVTSGVYFYQLVTEGFSDTKRMLLVK